MTPSLDRAKVGSDRYDKGVAVMTAFLTMSGVIEILALENVG
jgi:hypothetical protein